MVELQERVAGYFGYRRQDLIEHTRPKNVSLARKVAYLLVRERYGLSYPEIGHAFNRDHTTIMAGIRSLKQRLAANPRDWLWQAMEQLMPPGPRYGEGE